MFGKVAKKLANFLPVLNRMYPKIGVPNRKEMAGSDPIQEISSVVSAAASFPKGEEVFDLRLGSSGASHPIFRPKLIVPKLPEKIKKYSTIL